MYLTALVIGIALQATAPAAPRVAILSECDASSSVVAEVPRDAALEIHYSIADAPTCYFVSADAGGRIVRGFVVDLHAQAVVAFEQSRVSHEQSAFKAPLPLPVTPTPQPDPVQAAAPKAAPSVPVKAAEVKKPAHPKLSM